MYELILTIGIVAYSLILISFLTGMKLIKVKYKVHKIIGILGFSCATVHALFMLYFNLF
ncbi:MAG: hypothetical protein JXB24_05665 [Bacteroidales bacterium]|jgi:hypothetical protein|nr:hypothetical protein [Bacteroidales bacterium]